MNYFYLRVYISVKCHDQGDLFVAIMFIGGISTEEEKNAKIDRKTHIQQGSYPHYSNLSQFSELLGMFPNFCINGHSNLFYDCPLVNDIC